MLKKETCQHCSFFGSNFTPNRVIPKIFHLKFSKCVNWTKHLAKYQLILSNLTMLSSGGLNLSKSFSFDYSYFARGFIISGTKLRYNHLLWNPSAWQKSAFNYHHKKLYLQYNWAFSYSQIESMLTHFLSTLSKLGAHLKITPWKKDNHSWSLGNFEIF